MRRTLTKPRAITVALLAGALAGRPAGAQYVGGSMGVLTSTVDWQIERDPTCTSNCILDVMPAGSRRGLTPALSAYWRTRRWLGATTELRYAPKGYAVTTPMLRVDYLQLPLLARLGPMASRELPASVFLEAGLAPAVRVRCGMMITPLFRRPCTGEDLRRVDLSAIVGLGVSLRVRSGAIVAGTRVDQGLLDIRDGHAGPGGASKHRSTAVYAGWVVRAPGIGR